MKYLTTQALKLVSSLSLLSLLSVFGPVSNSAFATTEPTTDFKQYVFKMDNSSNGSYCSVFPITKDGYFLTALHCVRDCLYNKNRLEQAANSNIGLFDLMVVHNPESVQSSCDSLSIPQLKIKSVEVIATGSALSIFNSDFYTEYRAYYDELNNLGWDSKANDFALLKAASPSSLKCLPLAFAEPKGAAPITAVGFPLPLKKEDLPKLISSTGVVYSHPRESKYYVAQTSDTARRFVNLIYAAPGLIYSSVQNQPGQSGGPVLSLDTSSSAQRVQGLVSGYTQTDNKEAVHEMVGVTTTHIFESLPKALAIELQIQNQKCELN